MQPDPAQILFRDYRPADRGWVMAANARHYTEVEGFDASFARAVSGALDLLEAGRDDASRFLIVEPGKDAPPVGCVFFSPEDPRTGRLRLFYLDAAFRGRGIGRSATSGRWTTPASPNAGGCPDRRLSDRMTSAPP